MSLTLTQIAALADKRVPNADTDADKVAYLDILQRSLYRKFDAPERIDNTITTVANQGLYTLPDYIIPSRIKTVTIVESDGDNPVELDKQGYTESLGDNCYYALETATDSFIRVSPTPATSGNLILICFKDAPNALSSSDMTTVPRFFPDYHGIFADGLAAEIARWRKDSDLAQNWQAIFDEHLEEAIDDMTDMSPSLIKSEW